MCKQFLLLFIIIVNVSMYSQVVIKDEIILDEKNIYETGTESTGLTTPFYGNVKETILAGTIVCHISRTALIVNGAEYPFGPCWTWNCAPYPASCFCVAGNPATERTNIPAYTNVGTRFLKCKNVNGQYVWIELEHYYEIEISNENYQQYKIYSRVDAISNWQHVGWMEFNKTPPPPCNFCSDNSDEPCEECEEPIEVPNINLSDPNQWEGYLDSPRCFDEDGDPRLSFSSPAAKNISDFSISSYCFDLESQKWKFKMDNFNILRFNWVIDYCPENLPAGTSLLDFINVPNGYTCTELINDIELHLGHLNPNANPPTYFFKPLLRIHEIGHFNMFEQIFKSNYSDFIELWNEEIDFECEELPQNILDVWDKIYLKVISPYWVSTAISWRDEHISNSDIEKWIDDTYLAPAIKKLKADISNNPENYNCEP